MEGDFFFVPETKVVKDFNPLPPHGGRRSLRSILERRQKNFNPLPPHGGRLVFFNVFRWILHFNPLPPHGGRPRKRCFKSSSSFISIHSLRMEGDPTFLYPVTTGILFQSTPSAWRETFSQPQLSSTHKPFQSTPSAWRETKVHGVISPDCLHFNPLPPHGGRRHFAVVHANIAINFNPLPPHGGRLATARNTAQHGYFNPLPPHGGRRTHPSRRTARQYFNPLPPHGGRLCRDCHAALHGGISIHSLRMEGDQPHPAPTFRPDISIHSLRMEGDVF